MQHTHTPRARNRRGELEPDSNVCHTQYNWTSAILTSSHRLASSSPVSWYTYIFQYGLRTDSMWLIVFKPLSRPHCAFYLFIVADYPAIRTSQMPHPHPGLILFHFLRLRLVVLDAPEFKMWKKNLYLWHWRFLPKTKCEKETKHYRLCTMHVWWLLLDVH